MKSTRSLRKLKKMFLRFSSLKIPREKVGIYSSTYIKYIITRLKLFGIVGYVYLTRKFNDEHIVVQFDCQNEAEADELNDGDFSEGDTEDEENIAVNYGINFEVIITRNESKLVIDCVASKDLKVTNIQHVPKGRVHDEKELYSGL